MDSLGLDDGGDTQPGVVDRVVLSSFDIRRKLFLRTESEVSLPSRDGETAHPGDSVPDVKLPCLLSEIDFQAGLVELPGSDVEPVGHVALLELSGFLLDGHEGDKVGDSFGDG